MEHDCKHEVDLALMKDTLIRIERNLSDICLLLKGNDESMGLKGKTLRNWTAIKALFWINGTMAFVFIGALVENIFAR